MLGASAPPEDLSIEEKKRLVTWSAKHRDPAVKRAGKDMRWLGNAVEACLDWHRAAGKRKKDWVATCRVWIARDCSKGHGPAAQPRSTFDLDAVGDAMNRGGVKT